VAVDADEIAAAGRLQAAVECPRYTPARAAYEANVLVSSRPVLDDTPRAVGGVVVDDDHLD
jgi:hypothetical protein